MSNYHDLELVTGNLLEADTEALVNAVNAEGVMGKGIALQFKKKYPDMFEAYQRACKEGQVGPEECMSMNVAKCSILGHHQLSDKATLAVAVLD